MASRCDNPIVSAPRLILGSTSRYRRELLARLRWPFDVVAPAVDERQLQGESPAAMAQRLALDKARDVAARHPAAVVIGADQVADLDGEPIGKPGDHARAVAQLQRLSGRTAIFQTALAVVRADTGFERCALAPVRVTFRVLSAAEIERYLRLEQPYDCAGSAKCETLGIALLESIESDDPTALVGLPLIRTAALLRSLASIRWPDRPRATEPVPGQALLPPSSDATLRLGRMLVVRSDAAGAGAAALAASQAGRLSFAGGAS